MDGAGRSARFPAGTRGVVARSSRSDHGGAAEPGAESFVSDAGGRGDGRLAQVLHEEDPRWINIQGEPEFLGKGDRFLWTSERSGFRHLYFTVSTARCRSNSRAAIGRWTIRRGRG